MSKFKNDILIYQSESLQIEFVDSRFEGDLNKMEWCDLDKLADELANILNAIGLKVEAVPFLSIKEKKIGKKIKILMNPENTDIGNVAETFIREISKNDNRSGELFNQILGPHDEIIKKEAHKFLVQNSNKSIKHTLEIIAGNSQMKLAGKFAKSENQQIFDEPPEFCNGVVSALDKSARTVNLILDDQKKVTAFFDYSYFFQLHQLMLSDDSHKCKLQKKYDARGKKEMYLIEVDEGSSETRNLI